MRDVQRKGRGKNTVVAASEWITRAARFRLGGVRIGARLTACFLVIVLSMMAADLVAAWQFGRITAQTRRLSQADQTSLSVARVRLDVDTFRDKLAALASTHDIRQFRTEAASLRRKFVENVEQARQLLAAPSDTAQDPAIRSALETLRTTLPSQLDTTVELASAGDWLAVSLRIGDQVQSLIDLSSLLVEKVDRQVSQQRTEAIESHHRARRQLALILPVTAFLTLLLAIALGWYATRSITDPLSQLEAGARTLAQGDFQHRVAIRGEDELAQLGRVFNHTAGELATLYETLRSNEARFRLTIDAIPAYVWSALPDGSLDFINQRWLEFSGFSLKQGLAWGWEAAVHPADRDHFLEAWRAAIASGKAMEVEARVRRADGQYRWLLIRNVPLYDQNTTIAKWYGTSTDITERKIAEDELRESETRFRTFVDCATDAFFMSEFETGAILDVNRQACESLRYTRQELIGKTVELFDRERSPEWLVQNVRPRLEAGETVTFESRHHRKDGTVFPVEIRARKFRHAGHLVVFSLALDITERKRAEEERERLRQLEADLAHIHRASITGELAVSIAHEVNQPLAGVVNNGSACLRWLAGDAPNLEEAREATRRIIRDGKRAGDVINRIRAITRRAVTAAEKLDMNETIREVLALVGDEAKRNSVTIRTHFADDLFPVSGDRVQLQHVVLNLVMNGMEAMRSVDQRARELVITTGNVDADHVQVTVEDSGIGLDPNTIGKIFDAFYTTKAGGMGMGLSISRSILEAHGGRLWAAAKDGPGTIFHFTLPKYREEKSDASARV